MWLEPRKSTKPRARLRKGCNKVVWESEGEILINGISQMMLQLQRVLSKYCFVDVADIIACGVRLN
jgi:hypothetical protein